MLKAILRVVRIKNLVIVAATQYTMRFFIIQPLLNSKGMTLQLDELLFFLIVLATVFITAAGYVINDYFDTKTDLINRPDTVVVGKSISRRATITLHWILNILGVLFGVVASFAIGRPLLSIVFAIIPGLLWFYSTSYKRQFLLGNIIVATLTAMVPLMVLLFELPKLNNVYWQTLVFAPSTFNDLKYWIGGYTIFAFWLTLFREIIKDVEDFKGDKEFGRKTLPVVLGIKTTQVITASILLLTIMILVYLFGAHLNFLPSGSFDFFTLSYMIIALIIPIFILIIKLFTADKKEDYHWVSTFSKFVMLMGILYAIPFSFFVS